MPFSTWQRLKAADLRMHAAQYQSLATQTITDATNTKITVATVMYNYGGTITIGTSNTLTITKAGVYNIGAGVQIQGIGSAGSLASSRACYFWAGSGTSTAAANRYAVTNNPNLWGGTPIFCVSRDKSLTVGDTLSAYIWHNHGGNRDTVVSSELVPYLFARYVGDG